MKKILLLLTTTFLLASCGQMGKWEKGIDEFIVDVKEMNVDESEQLSDLIKKDMDDKQKELSSKLFETLTIEPEMKKHEEYNVLIDNLRSLQNEMKYEIVDIDVNEANTIATATIKFNYVNIGEKFESVVNNNLDKSILKLSAGESPNSFIKDTLTLLNDELRNVNLENDMVEKNAVIIIKKAQDEWKITEIDDNLFSVISLGMSDYLNNSFSDKLEEVKINKVFLEVESNFNEIADRLNNKVSKVKDIKGKKLAKELSEELGIDVHVGNSEDKENVYYVFESKGKVNISVMIDKELYTIKKELKPKKDKVESKKKSKK